MGSRQEVHSAPRPTETVWRFTDEHDRELPAAIDSDGRMPPALADRLVCRSTDPSEDHSHTTDGLAGLRLRPQVLVFSKAE
ncbi:hypothetical protein ACAH01_00515 [Halomicrobium sp. HM KBTZ05]|uniref:hypothetical protein n=1 Tax=Halomicrobium sp. HM KBTZ05 TaxID=3242663 RepID=UPI0035564F6F